ncbi:MAG: FAD-binding oxidoreductase [Candidatus Eiseniibacteriota bacterium]
MTTVSMITQDGGRTAIATEKLDALRGKLRGKLCLPGDPGYDEAGTIWNAMIDRKPAVIIRAQAAEDVAAAVNFARDNGLLLAVRGGGHNIAGHAVCEGGLMLDLSLMKSIEVNAAARTVRVAPGVTLGELDLATQAHGLALPVGINSTTGIAGLTLGGGFGWLSRKFGLTIDNLIAADIVTADGTKRRVNEVDEADLFWAVRGGGANMGVVTSFEFQLHPVGPEVFAGLIVHPFENAPALLKAYREVVARSSDDLTVWVVLRQAPPLPFIPAEWHGREVVVLAFCYVGGVANGDAAIAPLRAIGKPIAEHVGGMPLAGWQTAFDPLLTPGARNYWKSHDFKELSDGAIGAIADGVARLPGPECEVFIGSLGGAINRVAASATAYPHRDIQFVMNVHTRWRDAAQDQTCIAWARGVFDAVAPFATGGVYVNFMPDDEGERVKSGAYGPNFARLAALKAKYDPRNLFRLNQNVVAA